MQTDQRRIYQITSELVAKETIFGFYKGLASPLIACFGFNAVLFYSFNLTSRYLRVQNFNLFIKLLSKIFNYILPKLNLYKIRKQAWTHIYN